MALVACCASFIGSLAFLHFAITVAVCSVAGSSAVMTEEMQHEGGYYLNAALVMLLISGAGITFALRYGT